MHWVRFFLGTPRRALVSFLSIAMMALLEHFAPGAIAGAFSSLGSSLLGAVIELLNRFLGPVAAAFLPLIIFGIGVGILRSAWGGKR